MMLCYHGCTNGFTGAPTVAVAGTSPPGLLTVATHNLPLTTLPHFTSLQFTALHCTALY